MNTLKPCPFCGKEPQEITLNGEPKVVCRCLVREPNIWNTRPLEDVLNKHIAELEEKQRWIPVSERLPDGGHRAFYEVACIYQDFGELALFSKGRWVIYEGENVYDVTKRVKFWRKRQYLPDEVIAILSKGETNPGVTE